jgi:glycosyltransferase involved in cell wall biosynthesis
MIHVHRVLGTWAGKVAQYIALSGAARAKFIAGGFDPERIAVKPNFILEDPGPGAGGGRYALFVGRLSEEKGIGTMLRAWERLAPPLPLKIVGDGPMRPQVEAATRVVRNAEYLGRRSPLEVRELMGRAEFLVFPSTWYEGMPMTIIESFARGTPVVASRLGTMQEMIRDGENGALFSAGDPDDLARAVSAMSQKTQFTASLRAGARREFELKYTAERNYDLLMAVYERAIANR